ncbi:MAG: alpha/beta hydrolase family protein, partial [Polyangiales bacterium]
RDLGVDVAHVQLPFHGRRRPSGQLFHGEWFWTADLVRSLEAVRQAVIDVRTIMAWFRELGYEEVGVTGLSLGGCIAMLLACVEPLPDYAIPMIAHLELPDAIEEAPILWRMKDDLERFGIDRARRREIFTRVPLSTSVPKLPNEKQLWVAAREDGYLKAELVEQQWKRWNEPPILWIPGGHMTFPLALGEIVARMKAMPQKPWGPSSAC